MLEHGGDLARASREYGIPVERWLDLSTGINPLGYPVPQVPARAWLRLPGDCETLLRAAIDYYGVSALLPVSGTQAAIQALPRLRPRSRVLLATLTYSEHAHAWRRRDHDVRAAAMDRFEDHLGETDVLVVCNPNNPTGERIDCERLLAWHAALAERGGWLVVDEAYVDATPEASLARMASCPGLIVLRSVGKFFGLAGARAGFVLAEPALLRALADELGPWAVSGPAQFVVHAALSDLTWQAHARRALVEAAERLRALLAQAGVTAQGTALFQWWRHEHAAALHEALARQAIMTRLFRDDSPASIRAGLPGAEEEWQRLADALALWRNAQ